MSITLKGGANGPFIPVQEEASRNWLYKQIGVGEYIIPSDFVIYNVEN